MAGRKPLPPGTKRVQTNITIEPATYSWLKAQTSQTVSLGHVVDRLVKQEEDAPTAQRRALLIRERSALDHYIGLLNTYGMGETPAQQASVQAAEQRWRDARANLESAIPKPPSQPLDMRDGETAWDALSREISQIVEP